MAHRPHVSKWIPAGLAALLTLLPGFPAPRAATPARPGAVPAEDRALGARVDAWARPMVERGELSGRLLVSRGGRIVLERSFGWANLELRSPITAETRFNVASVTKPMTGMLAIELIAEGKIGLQDTIARWFPDFPKADSIRVTHLLRHRAGIRHDPVPDSERTRPFTAAEVVERAKKLPIEFSPGSRESYSSGNYEVLARILELASGKSYAALLEERVLRRAGMTRSGHVDSRQIVPGRASGYVPGIAGIENAALDDHSALVGAGSVWSTPRDLHALVQAIAQGKMVRGARESYVRNGRLDFNGRTGGFKAWAIWDSASGIGAAFAGNVATGAPDALKRAVPALARGETVAPPALPALRSTPLADDELRRWEGDFQIERGPYLRLRVRDGVLWSNDWVMWPAADGSMFSPRDYGIVRGVPGPGGTIARLDWAQGADHYPAPRVVPRP